MSGPETEIQRLHREIREKRDRADALAQAALSRPRLPDIEARVRRLEPRLGLSD